MHELLRQPSPPPQVLVRHARTRIGLFSIFIVVNLLDELPGKPSADIVLVEQFGNQILPSSDNSLMLSLALDLLSDRRLRVLPPTSSQNGSAQIRQARTLIRLKLSDHPCPPLLDSCLPVLSIVDAQKSISQAEEPSVSTHSCLASGQPEVLPRQPTEPSLSLHSVLLELQEDVPSRQRPQPDEGLELLEVPAVPDVLRGEPDELALVFQACFLGSDINGLTPVIIRVSIPSEQFVGQVPPFDRVLHTFLPI